MGVAVERESSILPLSVGLVLVLREASERGEQYISCSASCEQQREAGAEAETGAEQAETERDVSLDEQEDTTKLFC